LEDFFFEVFFGTFLPLALASDKPIAIACLRLLTLRPERPLFNVPDLRFFIARLTSFDELLEYFRAMTFSRLRENQSSAEAKVPSLQPGLIGGALVIVTIIVASMWRLIDEDRLLARNPPGYAKYHCKVRYRLIPPV
jgi:hypothetical protein